MKHDTVEYVFFIFIVLLATGLITVFACAVVDSFKPTFELRKDQWSCTKVYEYTTTTMVPVGKIMVPKTITHKDCIRYDHK